MQQIEFTVAPDDVPAARDRLAREVERLEAAGKRITVIRYPPSFAEKLKIAEGLRGGARYGKHKAVPLKEVPYRVVTEHEG